MKIKDIKEILGAEIICKDHRLITVKKVPEKYRSSMIFESIEIARALFDGSLSPLLSFSEMISSFMFL